jgi:hypothetical protein
MIIALSLFVEFIWLSYTNWITRSGWCGERTSIRRWRRGRCTPTTGKLKLLPQDVLHRPQDLQREPKDHQHEAQDLHHVGEGWCAKEATSTTSDHKFVFLSRTSSVWFNLLLLWWDECLGCIAMIYLSVLISYFYDGMTCHWILALQWFTSVSVSLCLFRAVICKPLSVTFSISHGRMLAYITMVKSMLKHITFNWQSKAL